MSKGFIKVFSWLLVVLWMALIFMLSAQPAGQSASLSGGIIRRILEWTASGFAGYEPAVQAAVIESFQEVVRTSAHFLAYFVLGCLCMLAISWHGFKMIERMVLSMAACVIYAVSDEVHQIFIAGRSAQFSDLCTDALGAALGILTAFLIIGMKRRDSRHW